MDLVPIKRDAKGYVAFALIVDKYTAAAVAVPIKSQTAAAIEVYTASMAMWLVDTTTIRVDSATALLSNDFNDAMAARGIRVFQVIPNHQQANFVERTVQTVKATIRTTLEGLPTNKWRTVLPDIIQDYNLAFQPTRGCLPFEALTGWVPTGILPFVRSVGPINKGFLFASREALRDTVLTNLARAQAAQAVHYNKSHEDRRFAVGDVVLMRKHSADVVDGDFNISSPYLETPFIVDAVLSEVTYMIHGFEESKVSHTAHVSDLKMAVLEEDEREALFNEPTSLGEQEFVVQ
jgi:hypothetical protein